MHHLDGRDRPGLDGVCRAVSRCRVRRRERRGSGHMARPHRPPGGNPKARRHSLYGSSRDERKGNGTRMNDRTYHDHAYHEVFDDPMECPETDCWWNDPASHKGPDRFTELTVRGPEAPDQGRTAATAQVEAED